MKLKKLNIISRLFVLGCMGLSSCVYDEAPTDGCAQDRADMTIAFSMVMQRSSDMLDSHSANSRGIVPPDKNNPTVWGDTYDDEEAIEFEERILEDGFTVVLSKDNAYAGHLSPLFCSQRANNADGSKEYRMHGTLVTDIPAERIAADGYKVMIIANTSGVTIEDIKKGPGDANDGLGSLKYRLHGKENNGLFAAIPMWGVKTANLSGIKPGDSYDIGTVDMLRAMAKVSVKLKSSIDQSNVSIKKIEILNYNNTGYALPGGWNTVAETAALRFDNTCRVSQPEFNATDTEVFISDDGKSVTFYLPEYDNPEVNAGSDVLDGEVYMRVYYSVKDENGVETNYNNPIRFCGYDEKGPVAGGNLWDIIRNHHYNYTMSVSGKTYPELRFEVRIEKMEKGGEYDYEYGE